MLRTAFGISLCLIIISNTNIFGQNKLDSLLDKTWKFESYIYKDNEHVISSEDLKYTLKFNTNKRFSGVASFKYWGRYKVNRKNEILVKRIFVPKSGRPGVTDSEEFEWRLQYQKNLGKGDPIYYEIEKGFLKLHISEKYIMVFKQD